MKCSNPFCNATSHSLYDDYCRYCGSKLIFTENERDLRNGVTCKYPIPGGIRHKISGDPLGNPPVGVKAVNLGLPTGTKWANMNIGAVTPEDIGSLFAWGETDERTECDWKTYSRCGGDMDTCYDLGRNISGTKFDVARQRWGGKWQIPSGEQVEELLGNCSFEWTNLNGVWGGILTGPNGNSIFLPCSLEESFEDYWLSEPINTNCALSFYVNKRGIMLAGSRICCRIKLMPIRPVNR